MIDWPGLLFPLWLALIAEPLRKDTIREPVKPVVFENKIDSVDVECVIVKTYPNWVSFDELPKDTKRQYETECGDIIYSSNNYNVGDKIKRRKKDKH